LEFGILGPLEAWSGGDRLDVGGGKQCALLAVLLVRTGEVLSTDVLLDQLWAGDPPPTAKTALQGYVSGLRKALGPDAGRLQTVGGGYVLRLDGDELDARRFERLAQRARASASGNPELGAELLREALGLWRGQALADFTYERFAQSEIARLEEARLVAVEDLNDAELACGRHAELVGELEAQVATYPLRERLRGQLVLALYRSGRQADALTAYQQTREVLVEELGIDPNPALQQLEKAILVQDPKLNAPMPAVGERDRVRLPAAVSSFIGREAELAELVKLVRGGARLVTLTGPGGTGKTRLAIEAAAELVGGFKAGVFWVPLATLRDPALVLDTIGQALGAKGDLAELGERELLLLLDNFEHVVDAAADLSALLSSCPNLHMLVTSRELLRIDGESEYAVPPLASDEAVELFGSRSGFDPSAEIAELCRRLDDMPLAVELAAARTSVLSPAQILERLSQRFDLLIGGRDKDPRQQTLRATIEWSYDLLTSDEQELFVRLSVFQGGCTVEAAEEVCHADLDVLQPLVDKSLVRHGGERFWMLETIREYAAELRRSSGEEAELDELHGRFFADLARNAEVGERGPDQAAWWQRLEDEVDNLRAALDRARDRGDHLQELELAVLLKRFWHVRSRLQEGCRRIEEALSAAGGADGVLRARALAALSMLICMSGGDASVAAELTEEALQFYSEMGDKAGVARMTLDLGVTADLMGDRLRARSFYECAQSHARNVGDLRYEYFAGHNLANLAFQNADPRAVDLGAKALDAARATGDPGNVQSATLLLAYILAGAGRAGEARELGVEVLRVTAAAGVQWVSRDALELLAITDVAIEVPERGVVFAGLAERLRVETSEPRQPSGERLYRPAMEEAEKLLGAEAFQAALARGAVLTVQEAVAFALEDRNDR
jgi:predicted ATPase/DNA-binding SARP family transcriptional activator